MSIERILGRGIQIANDVLAFERHRVYIRWSDAQKTEKIWHLRTGFFDKALRDKHLSQTRTLLTRVLSSRLRVIATTLDKQNAAVAWFRIGSDAKACIILIRDDPFSDDEKWLFENIAQLIEKSLSHPDCCATFDRLYLMFLHGRTLANISDSTSILRSYVRKAGVVCHPEYYDRLQGKDKVNKSRVRISAKLLTANKTSMRIIAFDAKPSLREWTKDRVNTKYDIADSKSIASRVYRTCRLYRTHRFMTDPNAKRIFNSSDDETHYTRSHLSSPILLTLKQVQGVLSLSRCLGVLSVETSESRAYAEEKGWALSLLAAHCAQPLARSLIREESIRKQDEAESVARTIARLRECGSWKEIMHTVDECLRQLDYLRTLFCQIDHESRTITGIYARGRAFHNLKKDTRRSFDDDHLDCQVLAALTGTRQIIEDPQKSPGANSAATELADLKPFGIFPFVDFHGISRWTVHVERSDLSPLGDMDSALVEQLTSAAMDAWERTRFAQIEALWSEIVFTEAFGSVEDLVRRFAEFVCEQQFASRCRVYDTSGERQVGVCQSGIGQVDRFNGFVLDESCTALLQKLSDHLQPVLFSRESLGTDPRLGVDVRFDEVRLIPHLARLRKESLQEWVEAPVVVEREAIVYKVSLDHWGKTRNCFSAAELRTIANLVRTLSFAADRVVSSELTSQLAREGLHSHILRHGILDVINQIVYQSSNVESPMRVLSDAKVTLKQLKNLARRSVAHCTIRDEIELVLKLLSRWLGAIEVRFDKAKVRTRLDVAQSPLAWILLTLVTNAIKAIALKNTAKPIITLDIRRKSGYLAIISVRDSGAGVSEEVANRLSGNPRHMTSNFGEGIGLAYARLLAEEHGWNLRLVRRASPTTFHIEIPNNRR